MPFVRGPSSVPSSEGTFTLTLASRAQVNSGSNGSDGAFNPTATNTVIDMHDHPNGIYQYTSINIPAYVTVTFIPNANNTPVIWLVQGGCVIAGTVDVSGQNFSGLQGGLGGPGGYSGGNGNSGDSPSTSGQGPGGGVAGNGPGSSGTYDYGNAFLIPLLGGSGGAGGRNPNVNSVSGGGGGGGAILIAASSSIVISGGVISFGGSSGNGGGFGSGGAIRLVAAQILGNGQIRTDRANSGRVRFDTYDSELTGTITGQFTKGFQPIIIPSTGQLPQLNVITVAGIPVSPSPTGALSTPDAVVSAQQANPVPIVVNCANLPLHSLITVTVKPMNGSSVNATAYNDSGTQTSSTATVQLTLPRGGGLIYATATTGN